MKNLNTENPNFKFQLNCLKPLFEAMIYRIHFKTNPKFPSFNTVYIGFSDMSERQVILRNKVNTDYDDDNDPIVAEYNTLEDLVLDGWELG